MRTVRIAVLQMVLPGLLSMSLILTGCWTATALQKVEKQLPLIQGVVVTIADFVAPEYAPTVRAVAAKIDDAVKELDTIFAQYKDNLAKAPKDTLDRVEALVATIKANVGGISALFDVLDPRTQNLVAGFVQLTDTVLLQLASLLPPQAATGPTLGAIRAQSRAQAQPIEVISAKDLAAKFNTSQTLIKVDEHGKVSRR